MGAAWVVAGDAVIDIAGLRRDATVTARERIPVSSVPAQVLLNLIEAVEAAHGAVLLTYDPSRTDAQNDEYQRRAKRLNDALSRFDFEAPA